MNPMEAITIVVMLFVSMGIAYVAGYVSCLQDEQNRKRAKR
jgi:hypothetical protein